MAALWTNSSDARPSEMSAITPCRQQPREQESLSIDAANRRSRIANLPGMDSMSAVIKRQGEPATGAIIIAGPSSHFTEEQMIRAGPRLTRVADELALVGSASPLLKAGNIGTWGKQA